jgi:hypothetical protein
MMTTGRIRIYRQAATGSRLLLEHFASDTAPFNDSINTISQGSTTIFLTSHDDAATFAQSAMLHARTLAARLSPRIIVPILLQAITDFYYRGIGQDVPWIGTALKLTVANLWNETNPNGRRTDSQKQLREAVAASGLAELLSGIALAFAASDGGRVEINGSDWTSEGDVDRALREFNTSFAARGRRLRTASAASQLLEQYDTTMKGIAKVLAGSNPADVSELSHTLLSHIPNGEPVAFWVGLWARLNIIFNLAVLPDDDFESVVIMHELPSARRDLNANERRAIDELYWTRAWRQAQPTWMLRHLIADRPILVIPERGMLTSAGIAADSITFFLESALFGYQDQSPSRLSANAFKSAVSEPFEKRIESLLLDRGFRAGQVTDRGVWNTSNGAVPLQNSLGEPPPGEIDVLAASRKHGIVLLIECKVLGMPFTESRLRNLLSKIGPEDAESFFSKMRKKAAWLRRVSEFHDFDDGAFVSMLVLDRRSPGMQRGSPNIIVCSEEDVRDVILPNILAHGN